MGERVDFSFAFFLCSQPSHHLHPPLHPSLLCSCTVSGRVWEVQAGRWVKYFMRLSLTHTQTHRRQQYKRKTLKTVFFCCHISPLPVASLPTSSSSSSHYPTHPRQLLCSAWALHPPQFCVFTTHFLFSYTTLPLLQLLPTSSCPRPLLLVLCSPPAHLHTMLVRQSNISVFACKHIQSS